jgi:hypothetical protein
VFLVLSYRLLGLAGNLLDVFVDGFARRIVENHIAFCSVVSGSDEMLQVYGRRFSYGIPWTDILLLGFKSP